MTPKNIVSAEIVIIGGGPAGLCAAIAAAEAGSRVILLDRDSFLGGQLIKQTHMFFGSQKQHASTRGVDIAELLKKRIAELSDKVTVMTNSTVIGLYEVGMLTVDNGGKEYIKIKPQSIIIATGASEKFLSFPNNDLPGIYGAGAVQTLMNVHGVKPGDNVVMIGAGNIGLIVSYQLTQAGVNVKAIVDAAPRIGGFLVHASKIRRLGIPILTGYSIKTAVGNERLEKVVLQQLNEKWQPVEGAELEIEADVLCISVGLTPLAELLWQSGCEMKFIPELGGHVPVRDEFLKTSVENIYIAGDVGGVEEASSAMVEGRLAGLCAAYSLGYGKESFERERGDCMSQLEDLRSGPVGEKVRAGIQKIESGR